MRAEPAVRSMQQHALPRRQAEWGTKQALLMHSCLLSVLGFLPGQGAHANVAVFISFATQPQKIHQCHADAATAAGIGLRLHQPLLAQVRIVVLPDRP